MCRSQLIRDAHTLEIEADPDNAPSPLSYRLLQVHEGLGFDFTRVRQQRYIRSIWFRRFSRQAHVAAAASLDPRRLTLSAWAAEPAGVRAEIEDTDRQH